MNRAGRHENGAYLVGGAEIRDSVPGTDAQTASKGTIAYGILKSHNTSGEMDHLKIRFDKLASHGRQGKGKGYISWHSY